MDRPAVAADHHVARGAWEFDGEVTAVFDDMLARSIPDYATMREVVTRLALRTLRAMPPDHRRVLDLGCSRGGALAPLLAELPDLRCVGIENSAEMRSAARTRFAGKDRVTILEHDLRFGLPGGLLPHPSPADPRFGLGAAQVADRTLTTPPKTRADVPRWTVVLAVLTLQFVALERRQRVLDDIRRAIAPDGALLVVEKVTGGTGLAGVTLEAEYLEMKARHGYTAEQIDAKREALQGVLVPLTADENEERLRHAGFEVEPVWRALNFAAWMAWPK